jgi:hypothetical protein
VSTALISTRGTWVLVDVTAAGWPLLQSSTYYWVALTPRSSLLLAAGNAPNGAIWAGVSDVTAPLPAAVRNDAVVFTARELRTQRSRGDAAFACSSAAAVQLVWNASTPWPSVTNASVRYTPFVGTRIRYGIQIIGWQSTPSGTPTPSMTPTISCACAGLQWDASIVRKGFAVTPHFLRSAPSPCSDAFVKLE